MSGQADDNSVTVTYSAADIAAMNLLIWPFWITMLAIMGAIVFGAPVLTSIVDGAPAADAVAAIDWLFAAGMFLILIAWVTIVTVVIYWMRRRRGLHGPIRFSLNNDGVAFQNRRMSGLVFWGSIKSIRISRGRIFLFMSRRSALMAPRRAFESGDQFDAFFRAAQELRGAVDVDQPRNLAKSVTVE